MRYSKDTNYQHLLHSKEWRTLRNRYLHEHPICEYCHCYLATEVHHIVPLNRFRNDLLKMEQMCFDEDNLMAVDHTCHEKLHTELGKNKNKVENAKAYHEEKLKAFYQNYFE